MTDVVAILGPAACQDCRVPLFFTGERWMERHWWRDPYQSPDAPLAPLFKIHTCTAKMPLVLPSIAGFLK